MPSITDRELVTKLLEATKEGRLQWAKTGQQDQFAAKYAAKWTLTVDKTESDNYSGYWLALSNAEGEELLKIWASQEEPVDRLFEVARRQALRIDEALSDLFNEIGAPKAKEPEFSDDDIPF